jgi:serine acetyltransferase
MHIKSNTFIGSGLIILPGETVGSYVSIGAGSLVTKNVLDNAEIIGKF